jgi:hypothetical protein
MSSPSPGRFTPRAGSRVTGAVRRALDGQIDSQRRYGETLSVAKDGRLEVKAVRGGGLKMTRQGLAVDQAQVGEKNRPPLPFIREPASGASAADLRETLCELLRAMRKTGNMRG